MKQIKLIELLAISLLVLSLIGCQKDHTDLKLDVNNYITLLKANNYESEYLPDFEPEHIPALLKYRSDTTTICNVPHNPLSSFSPYRDTTILGLYVLWTIESIRITEINGNKHPMNRFPSLHPILAKRDSGGLELVYDNNSFQIAAKAYYYWWNKIIPFIKLKNIDPLDQTEYRWF